MINWIKRLIKKEDVSSGWGQAEPGFFSPTLTPTEMHIKNTKLYLGFRQAALMANGNWTEENEKDFQELKNRINQIEQDYYNDPKCDAYRSVLDNGLEGKNEPY